MKAITNVSLTLSVSKYSSEYTSYIWIGILRDEKSGKEKLVTGCFKGPLTEQQAINYAMVEITKNFKKPVNITVYTAQKINREYFNKALSEISPIYKLNDFQTIDDTKNLEKCLAYADKKYKKSEPDKILKFINHQDFDEVA